MNTNRDRRRMSAAIVALIAGGLLLSGCTGIGANPSPSPAATSTPAQGATGGPFAPSDTGVHREDGIVYRTVGGEKLTVNACTPQKKGGPIPAVLVIHGGGFHAGTNTVKPAMTACQRLAQAGMAGFSVGYRLAPEHPYPAAVEDVQAAVEWLREPAQVQRFGIDPKRIGALGSSAGANLAMELGTLGTGGLTTGSRIAATVSLSGPTDMTAAGIDLGDSSPRLTEIALAYLDCTSIASCPAATGASPRYQVDSTDASLFIANSTNELIPLPQAQVMITAMKNAGVPVTTDIIGGKAHGFAYLHADMWTKVVAFLHTYLSVKG